MPSPASLVSKLPWCTNTQLQSSRRLAMELELENGLIWGLAGSPVFGMGDTADLPTYS